MVHDVSVCRRAFELVSVKYPRTAASPMADVRRPPPRCTEITCTAIFVCILDRGRFWGSTQPEPVILHGLKPKRSGTWVGNGHSHK
jgi:hypothetical protein